MSINTNLEAARRYEWNASMAKSQGDEREANRYEYMAKMALIDTAMEVNKNSVINNRSQYSSSYTHTSGYLKATKEHPIVATLTVSITSAIIVCAYIIGTMI